MGIINKWRILFEYFLCIKSGFPVGAGRNTNNIVWKYEPHVYYITIILSYFQFFLKHWIWDGIQLFEYNNKVLNDLQMCCLLKLRKMWMCDKTVGGY